MGGLGSGRIPARHEARDAAARMWAEGLSRATIAQECQVRPETISSWRYQDGWPARKAYTTRQIPRARMRNKPREEGKFLRERPLYACPHCGTRAGEPTGHPSCQPVAA